MKNNWVLVLLFLLVGVLLVAIALGAKVTVLPSFDCTAARAGAAQIVKDYPQITVPYTGEQEKQCRLNDVVEQLRNTK